MQNNLLYTTNPSVYPGEYVPLFKENDLKRNMKHSCKNKTSGLSVNIKEFMDSYKIELAVPGVKRENLLLKARGNVLSISVIHYNHKCDKQNFQPHEFNFKLCYTHDIVLPDNADSIFVSAKYKYGIVHLHLPKSTHPLKWTNAKIAIY